jgi:hypothetical protein
MDNVVLVRLGIVWHVPVLCKKTQAIIVPAILVVARLSIDGEVVATIQQ